LAADERWSIREEEDLTDGVLNSSRRLTPWYRQRFRVVRWLPPLYATLDNFACLQGSHIHRKLAEGEWVYQRLVLVKRDDGAREHAARQSASQPQGQTSGVFA
jgi:hypothetical protein